MRDGLKRVVDGQMKKSEGDLESKKSKNSDNKLEVGGLFTEG